MPTQKQIKARAKFKRRVKEVSKLMKKKGLTKKQAWAKVK